MAMTEGIGWIGSMLLAFCGVPQAIKSFRDGHSDGLSGGFILMWILGEVFALWYVVLKAQYPLIFNYGLNLLIIAPIIWYKLHPRKAHFTVAK